MLSVTSGWDTILFTKIQILLHNRKICYDKPKRRPTFWSSWPIKDSFLFYPLLTQFVRLVWVWSLTVAILSSNIGEDFTVSKLSETFCLPSVLNRNCVHTNHLSRRKKIKNCASISCTHINHILDMLILVTYAGSTLLNCVIQPFWPCALFPLLTHNGK